MTAIMAVISSSSRTRSASPVIHAPRKRSTTKSLPSSSIVSSAPVLPITSLSSSPRSVRLSESQRSISSRRCISAKKTTTTTKQSDHNASAKRMCLCSRSSHPGSFRCSLHLNQPRGGGRVAGVDRDAGDDRALASRSHSSSNRLNLRRLAMANSLLRIGAAIDLVKRVMPKKESPSVPERCRRVVFRALSSRFAVHS